MLEKILKIYQYTSSTYPEWCIFFVSVFLLCIIGAEIYLIREIKPFSCLSRLIDFLMVSIVVIFFSLFIYFAPLFVVFGAEYTEYCKMALFL